MTKPQDPNRAQMSRQTKEELILIQDQRAALDKFRLKVLKLRYQNLGGQSYYYPANELAKAFLLLMDRKALMDKDIRRLKKIGKLLEVNLEILVKRERPIFNDQGQKRMSYYETKE